MVKETVEVELANGQLLKVTPEHKILTTEGWKEAGSLTENDQVLVQSGSGYFRKEDNIGEKIGLFLGCLTGDGWLTSYQKVLGMVLPRKKNTYLTK